MPSTNSRSRDPFPGLLQAVVLLTAAVALQAMVSQALEAFWPKTRANWTFQAGVTNLIALSLVILYASWRLGHLPRFSSVPQIGRRFWLGMVLSVVGGTAVLGELANLTTWFFPLSPELTLLFNQLSHGNPWISLFTIALVAPVTEEALFRGIILPGFTGRWGTKPGLLLSSAFFALFHLNVWQAPAAFVAGLYLGWLALRTGSLLYPVVAHAIFNGLPVLLTSGGFLVKGYNSPTVSGIVEFQPPLWVVGGLLTLGLGLWMTRRWAPLSPPLVSDRLEP